MHKQVPLVAEDAVPGAHVQALMAGVVVHVVHEHPQFCGAMQPAPPTLVARRHCGHDGQHTDVHS